MEPLEDGGVRPSPPVVVAVVVVGGSGVSMTVLYLFNYIINFF